MCCFLLPSLFVLLSHLLKFCLVLVAKPKVTGEPQKSKHKNEEDSIKKPEDSKKIPSKSKTGEEDPGKETEGKEEDGYFKEETVVVEPEDTSGKPTEEPLYPGAKTEEDPHAVKEWRTWFNQKDQNEVANTGKPSTNTKQSTVFGKCVIIAYLMV